MLATGWTLAASGADASSKRPRMSSAVVSAARRSSPSVPPTAGLANALRYAASRKGNSASVTCTQSRTERARVTGRPHGATVQTVGQRSGQTKAVRAEQLARAGVTHPSRSFVLGSLTGSSGAARGGAGGAATAGLAAAGSANRFTGCMALLGAGAG